MRYELLKRYCITIYYLKFKQIYYRIKYLVYRPEIANFKLKNQINLRNQKLGLKFYKSFHVTPFVDKYSIIFLNKKIKVNFRNDWNNNKLGKLWLYNLNYFDFLNSKNKVGDKYFYISIIKNGLKIIIVLNQLDGIHIQHQKELSILLNI